MHMNQPVWVVEDRELKNSEEGRKKLQQVADDHAKAKSSSRLTIVHGEDFDKVWPSINRSSSHVLGANQSSLLGSL